MKNTRLPSVASSYARSAAEQGLTKARFQINDQRSEHQRYANLQQQLDESPIQRQALVQRLTFKQPALPVFQLMQFKNEGERDALAIEMWEYVEKSDLPFKKPSLQNQIYKIIEAAESKDDAYKVLNEKMNVIRSEEPSWAKEERLKREEKERKQKQKRLEKKQNLLEEVRKKKEERMLKMSSTLNKEKPESNKEKTEEEINTKKRKRKDVKYYEDNLEIMAPILNRASEFSVKKMMINGGYLDEQFKKTKLAEDLEKNFKEDKIQYLSTAQQFYLTENFINKKSGDYIFEQSKDGKEKQVSMPVSETVPSLRGKQIVPLGAYDEENKRSEKLEKMAYKSEEQAKLILFGNPKEVEKITKREKKLKVDPYRELRARRNLKNHEGARFNEIATGNQLSIVGAKHGLINLTNDYYNLGAKFNPMEEENATTNTNPSIIDYKDTTVKNVLNKNKNIFKHLLKPVLEEKPKLEKREESYLNEVLNVLENEELLKKIKENKSDWEDDIPGELIQSGADFLRSPDRNDLRKPEDLMLIEDTEDNSSETNKESKKKE